MLKRLILSLMLALVLCTSAFAQSDGRTVIDYSSTSVSSAAAVTLIARNPQRHFLFIQNTGSVDIWINYTGTAAASGSGSFKLPAGASVTHEGSTVPRNAVSIKAGSGTGAVAAYEG